MIISTKPDIKTTTSPDTKKVWYRTTTAAQHIGGTTIHTWNAVFVTRIINAIEQ
jgi:hypothetical protein